MTVIEAETRKGTMARTVACPECGGVMRAVAYRCRACRRRAEERHFAAVMESREHARQQGHDVSGYRCRLCGRVLSEAFSVPCPVTTLEQGRRERIARGGTEG